MLIISKTLQETMTANVVGKVLSYCFTVCSNIALRHLQIACRQKFRNHKPVKVQKAVGPTSSASSISKTIKYSEMQYSEVLSM